MSNLCLVDIACIHVSYSYLQKDFFLEAFFRPPKRPFLRRCMHAYNLYRVHICMYPCQNGKNAQIVCTNKTSADLCSTDIWPNPFFWYQNTLCTTVANLMLGCNNGGGGGFFFSFFSKVTRFLCNTPIPLVYPTLCLDI